MKKLVFTLICAFALAACSPKVATSITNSYPPFDESKEVYVIGIEQSDLIIEKAKMLGTIKIGDTGFTSRKAGSWESVIEIAKQQARQAGGNVIRITSHIPPNLDCTTHRITADILRVPDVSNIVLQKDTAASEHPDYAVVYFYRNSSLGALVNYDVHIGDTPVYRAKVNSAAEVKIYESGILDIWAKTEAKETLTLKVELGEEYYVRCDVTMGAFVGRPDLELVHPITGKGEYKAVIQNQK
ncbi:MAG: hypothetical protein J5693_04465 [Bacteroidales bacterium]|nr:hypothetical protein [Bacteroidales bacterium]